ncbi:DUF1302 family protein [Porticoccus sp.]|uniref:DUF1302 family protein n=1 Tax=Porticoccus sp. TaxID=2024853 RepID=UPI003F6A1C99
MKNNTSIKKVGGFLLGFGGLMAAASPTFAADFDYGLDDSFFKLSYNGYVRTTVGVLLQDSKETEASDQWRMNQARATVNVDWDIKTGPLNWRVVTRVEHEHKTDYLDDISERTDSQNATLNGFKDLGFLPNTDLRGNYGRYGKKGSFMEQYETTDELMDIVREIYFDWQITDRLFARIGRQQLVWGESDFFQAMDVVHGYDFRQRLFYENNEEWRKPLFLLNFVYEVHEWDGMVNFFVRPGMDRSEDMGSNYNIEGGRWIPTPYRGVDFTQVTDAYNEDHNKGDWDDWTYGIRWNGRWGSAGYSFSYMKTFNPAPVINPNQRLNAGGDLAFWGSYYGVGSESNTTAPVGLGAAPGTSWMPQDVALEGYGDDYNGSKLLGEWLYPEIDVFGFTVNYFSMAMDSTLSAEVAFIPNKPYNYGQLQSDLPGWGGIKEKDTLNVMLRIDKEFKWQEILGTHRPSLSSVQLFDTWIINRKKSDEIVEFASFGEEKSEHTVYLTLFTLLNYTRDTINPSLVVGTDLTNGGGFVIPAVEFVWGNDWRLKVEADLWWNDGDRKKTCGKADADTDLGMAGCDKNVGDDLLGTRENNASFMDWFARDNQLVFKLTRQF